MIFLLIFLQFLFGWYMVESGLVNDVTVSYFRLGTHLVTAFILDFNYLLVLFEFYIQTIKKII